jgi:hypothetical protein
MESALSNLRLGDAVHIVMRRSALLHPRPAPCPYISRASNQPAIGIIVGITQRSSDHYDYQVLLEGELGWWNDFSVKLIED